MILFDNKTKIKWEHDTSIERKFFKKSKAQTLASQILNDEIENKYKKKTAPSPPESAYQIHDLVVRWLR